MKSLRQEFKPGDIKCDVCDVDFNHIFLYFTIKLSYAP